MRKAIRYIVMYPFYEEFAVRTALPNGLHVDEVANGLRVVWSEGFAIPRGDLRDIDTDELALLSRDEVKRGEREYLKRAAKYFVTGFVVGFDDEFDVQGVTMVEAEVVGATLVVRWRGWRQDGNRRRHLSYVEIATVDAYTNELRTIEESKLFEGESFIEIDTEGSVYFDSVVAKLQRALSDDV